MRKKLHFDETFDISRSLYIFIDSGKIREYEGADFMPLILHGKPQPEFKTFELNSDFELIKVSKYDQKKLNIKANYKINSNYIFSKILKDAYIKLNPFEKFKIDYDKKQTVYHKMEFYQKILAFIIFGLLSFFAKEIYQGYSNKENKPKQTQSPNPESTTINQEINIPIIKADSVSIKTIKFERGSLESDSIINNNLTD